MQNPNHFTLFEHGSLKEGEMYNGIEFTTHHHTLFENFYKEKNFPYYQLIRKGVRFCSYVGVLQIGNMTIEVLPKADKVEEDNAPIWRNILIGMLRAVGLFTIHAPSSSALKLQSNSILDLYFDLYLTELEYLLHRGLVKRYRKTEGNTTALKGSLQFGKHIQQNLVHQERFYVRHTTYDAEHQIHAILYKALRLLKQINTKSVLQSRIGALLLNFPEMPDLKVSEATFEKIVYNRKDEHYQKALEIARLLLLNYHPDVAQGRNSVLALMFDMNILWEQFVYVSLRKNKKENWTVAPQYSKPFWQQAGKYPAVKMRPDIVIEIEETCVVVLDTKWKNLNGRNPSPEDLRQMYVYHEYYGATKVALVYPNKTIDKIEGHFLKLDEEEKKIECSILFLAVPEKVDDVIRVWQKDIFEEVNTWIGCLAQAHENG